ncbi:MAG TPA: serine hydrolase [Puia sp.]|nr:serine hydrolase [Puia sp.]
MNKHIIISTILFFAFHISNAQVKNAASPTKQIRRLDGSMISTSDIDKTITQLMSNAEVTGFCISIINDNKITYTKTYGLKNKEKNELIDTSTVFYGASLSKAVFAYIVMQLVQEGVIDIYKPIWAYINKPLPMYESYNNLADDERWKFITVRDCLRHATGFPNWRWFNPKGNNQLEIFFDPGERYAYSGEGILLLQLAVEETTHKSLEQLAQERVFKPLGMTRTSYVWQTAFENNFAFGYNENGEMLKKKKRSTPNAAGSMETTIADYSRFIEAVMQSKGLADSTKHLMLFPQIPIKTKHQFPSLNTDTAEYPYKNIDLSYGLGWGLFKCNYGKAFFKEGHDDGWAHYNVNFPDKKISLIMMSNSSNAEGIFKEALEKLIGDTYTPWDWENYKPYTPKNIAPKEIPKAVDTSLNEYAGIYAADTVKTVITIEDGQLKVQLDKGGLQKSALYMEKPDLFSLKMAAIQFQFIRNANGKIEKMIIVGGNEQHEFKKIN